jgi:hypothetical protein
MSFQTDNPDIDFLVTELVDATKSVKTALVDGKFSPDDVVAVVRSVDPVLADDLGKWMHALAGLYPEVKALANEGPFKMLMEAAPYFASKLMGVFQ